MGSQINIFLIGVAASIAAYGIIKLLIRFTIIVSLLSKIPWFNGISGEWYSTYTDTELGTNIEERINIYRFGKSVTGKMLLIQTGKPIQTQKIKGVYKDLILTAEYWSTDKDVIERGTIVLKRENQVLMTGFYSYFSGTPLTLHQSKYSWHRP